MNWEEKLGIDQQFLATENRLEALATEARQDAASAAQIQDVPNQEITFDYQQAHDAARDSLDFLAGIAMPTTFRYLFPFVFQSVWHWLVKWANTYRTFPRLALGLPRGFGKSTVIKLFILYLILFTKRQFILVTCATGSLAENLVADVLSYLREPNIVKIFGDYRLGMIKDTQALQRFGFRGRDIIIVAMGQGGSLRGLNLGDNRPDVMIFDDIQTREQANSEVESTNIENWLFGTAMKAKSPHGCMYIFIANMYPTKHSILRKLKKNQTWIKFIAGGILADGSSLWEELHPIAQLLDEYEADKAAGKAEIFHAEVLNDENAAANNLIDLAKVPDAPNEEGDVPAGKFLVIDPSNDKANSDAVSITYNEIHYTANNIPAPVTMRCVEGRFSPGDTIREAVKLALQTGTRVVGIESNGYQASLGYWFNEITKQLGIIGIEAVEVYSGKSAKTMRILNWLKAYKAGDVFVHPEARGPVHSQILSFNPLKTDNVDGLLDCCTYAPKMIELYGPYIISLNELEMQDHEAVKVRTVEENSCF